MSKPVRGFFFFVPVSEAPKIVAAPKKFASYNPKVKTDEEKKEEVTERDKHGQM